MIINGSMAVTQRGISFSNPNGYTLDRFRNYGGTGGALTVTQESFTVGQTDVPTAKHFMRMNQTTSRSGGAFLLQHRIEDVQSVPEGNITLSFYAKAGASKELKIQPYQIFGSGGSSTVALTKQTLTLGTSWQKFTFVVNNTSISGKTVGTGSYFMIEIRDESQGTYTFDLALLKLEVGDTATPFEHRSYGEELAACQRYFELLDYSGSVGNAISNSTQWGGTTDQWGNIMYKYPKRATPSGSVSGSVIIYGKGNISTATTPTLQYISKVGLGIRVQPSSFTSDVGFIGNSSNFKLSVDAEL